MHRVGRIDWAFGDAPPPPTATGAGIARQVLVNPAAGSVHTELAVGALTPGGWIARHLHSFEETLYLLEGDLVLELDGRAHRLVPGDFAIIPVGTLHTIVATTDGSARWLATGSPPRRGPEAPVPDTVYAADPPDVAALLRLAGSVVAGDPRGPLVGHDPAFGGQAADPATLVLDGHGITVRMLIDRELGADQLTVSTVECAVGGAAPAHDHPFEETYVVLAGTIAAELDGRRYTLRSGDIAFAAVGCVHAFRNDGHEPARWIEVQAPQPPARHGHRWEATWRAAAERGVPAWP